MAKGEQLTIMVVDDDKRMREVIKDTLADIPCSIIEFSNGLDAVEGYNTVLPDWVLMDVMMRPMNGITALQKIKRDHPEAKVIMVTGATEDSVSAASFKAGAFAFVQKESLSTIPDMILKC